MTCLGTRSSQNCSRLRGERSSVEKWDPHDCSRSVGARRSILPYPRGAAVGALASKVSTPDAILRGQLEIVA